MATRKDAEDPKSSLSTPAERDIPEGELFQIIDETGEGFGFDLTPETLAKPFAIGAVSLFTLGMMAGIPFGLAMGRSQETKGSSKKITPTMGGIRFAATTFGLGTLLCSMMGAAGFYGIKTYYHVNSFEEFGRVMRETVPDRRAEMEKGLAPVLAFVRKNAGENLPGPMKSFRDWFHVTRLGKWIKRQVDSSVTTSDQDSQCSVSESSER
ncbi:hypothetical protein BWQ96_06418 [Gracilariopsis chorda]|uniref:Transmembrane protein 242 n=1 Tax=Gracilariopsis chorda TaxID=448386 RepID=A0A2V3IP16_9FLOR|nr:hypothetical protein BWQ96_06418 [Gracilariopsis chorda]|eukprot:PXF43797.1 hypothetical protein BWQ96_06418 [Gracilariopsis chorda]